MPRPGPTGWTTGHRLRSGMPGAGPADPRPPSWRATIGCATTFSSAWPVLSV